MSCRPSRDFPSLSNKIPGEQAAGFGREPAGDPPSPTRMPGSPGPGSSLFPVEPGGPQNSSLLLPGPVTLQGSLFQPKMAPQPPGKQTTTHPLASPQPQSLLQKAIPVQPLSTTHPHLNLSTCAAWVLDLTSGFEGSQGQGCASLRLGLLRTGPCVLQL